MTTKETINEGHALELQRLAQRGVEVRHDGARIGLALRKQEH
jgi:flagellar motor switch/type III secretory pathway protein FliN